MTHSRRHAHTHMVQVTISRWRAGGGGGGGRGNNNKQVISRIKFAYPRLTLKEGTTVKSNHTKRFSAHDFLCVGLPSHISRTNNK